MIEEKIKELGFKIPQTPQPLAAYIPALQAGDMVYTSGQVPIEKGELKYAARTNIFNEGKTPRIR